MSAIKNMNINEEREGIILVFISAGCRIKNKKYHTSCTGEVKEEQK